MSALLQQLIEKYLRGHSNPTSGGGFNGGPPPLPPFTPNHPLKPTPPPSGSIYAHQPPPAVPQGPPPSMPNGPKPPPPPGAMPPAPPPGPTPQGPPPPGAPPPPPSDGGLPPLPPSPHMAGIMPAPIGPVGGADPTSVPGSGLPKPPAPPPPPPPQMSTPGSPLMGAEPMQGLEGPTPLEQEALPSMNAPMGDGQLPPGLPPQMALSSPPSTDAGGGDLVSLIKKLLHPHHHGG